MPQLKTHIYFGLFTYPLAYFLIALALVHLGWLNLSVPFDVQTMVLGYFVYVIGSDLPDIDSRSAPIHHFLKILASILGVFMILNWTSVPISKNFPDFVTQLAILSVVMFAGGVVSYLVITAVLSLRIFDHRKFAHSISFAALYGALLYVGLYKDSNNSLFIAVLGSTGVVLHLILDTIGDFRHGNKSKALKLW